MEDRLFEGPLAGIVIDWGSWLARVLSASVRDFVLKIRLGL
jgi:hypothetical protein